MLERLTGRRADAERRYDEAAAAIPAAILDGDEARVAELRGHRTEAALEADDLGDAIDLAAERERRSREEAEAERLRKNHERAVDLAGERVVAAAEVDEVLAALETKVVRYQAIGRELGSLTRTGSAISRKESQNMRWAIWARAEQTAMLLCVPFANGRRRRTLAQLEDGR